LVSLGTLRALDTFLVRDLRVHGIALISLRVAGAAEGFPSLGFLSGQFLCQLFFIVVKNPSTFFLFFACLAHHGRKNLFSAVGANEYRKWYDLVLTVHF